ncbi:unnamed protein product [Ixodes persulcatus]
MVAPLAPQAGWSVKQQGRAPLRAPAQLPWKKVRRRGGVRHPAGPSEGAPLRGHCAAGAQHAGCEAAFQGLRYRPPGTMRQQRGGGCCRTLCADWTSETSPVNSPRTSVQGCGEPSST